MAEATRGGPAGGGRDGSSHGDEEDPGKGPGEPGDDGPQAASPAAPVRLEAADGLVFTAEDPDDPAGRVAWGEGDWWGPVLLRVARPDGVFTAGPGDPRALREREEGEDELGPWAGLSFRFPDAPLPLRLQVRAYAAQPLLVFRCEAERALEGLATGTFGAPSVAWPWLRCDRRRPDGLPEGAVAFGHQYTEFGLPSFSPPHGAGFFLLPFRPAVVMPLFLRAPDGRALGLLPRDAFHEQVVAVPRGEARAEEGLRCGWHGDLDAVPEGFASELALWGGPGVRAVLEAHGAWLQRRSGTRRPSRHADAAVGRLSYWTDNGAAYWYRSEPGHDLPGTLEAVMDDLRERRVPVASVELDSWFYPHQILRSFDPAYPEEVPPTGALLWEPREDVLPEGVQALRRRLGDPPLVLHARHFSSRSPYFEGHPAWVDGDRAHPRDGRLMDALFAQAATWGAVQVEHDWLIECFLGVRGLRERPGRARAWQEDMDRRAAEHGLHLLWCMASPADFWQTATLERVAAIRTSGDYRYRIGNAALWCWFLYGSALARALGLWPFKDVFLSCREGEGVDGDACAEAEALLAALSAGPVGIGDRVGRADREVVLRTCREDGVLVKPDLPLAPLERCFARHPHLHPEPLLAETASLHPAGRWTYLTALHAWRGEDDIAFELAPGELGEAAPARPALLFDWRSRRARRLGPGAPVAARLAPRDWRLWVLCPLLTGDLTVLGDLGLYACVGDRRVRGIREEAGGVEWEVLGTPGERARVHGWAEEAPRALEAWAPGSGGDLRWSHDPRSGLFQMDVTLGAGGWTRLRATPAG